MAHLPPSQPPAPDFELLEQSDDGGWVRLRFSGPFEGVQARWDATFRTAQGDDESNAIEIGEEGRRGRALTVTLALPRFDLPAIRKTIIMIRQYKRLRRGRHEFG